MANVIDLAAAQAGDFVFSNSPGDVSRMIRLAQRIRWHGADFNHVGWLDNQDSDGTWRLGQAEGKGVTNDKPLVLGPNDRVVQLPATVDRARVLSFGRAQVGDEYGFLTDASVFVTLLTPEALDLMVPGTWICSALVGEMARFGGWYHDWPDIYQVAPDPLFLALTEG